MAYTRFRLYYKIDLYRKSADDVDWDNKLTIDEERVALADFMEGYNDTFFECSFSVVGKEEKQVKQLKHFPSFDKELGLCFIVEFETQPNSGIEKKDFNKAIEKIKWTAQETDSVVEQYSDCVSHGRYKNFEPRIDSDYARVVIDLDEECVHARFNSVDEIENLDAYHFDYGILFHEQKKQELESNKHFIDTTTKMIAKAKLSGSNPNVTDKQMKALLKHFQEKVDNAMYIQNNKDKIYLK